MPIPTYDQFIEPLLRFLARHPAGARTAEIYEPPADEMGLTESERPSRKPRIDPLRRSHIDHFSRGN
jgi:restriction endonuclease Mrr